MPSLALLLFSSAKADTVALWLFDDPPGSPAAIDSSGHGHHLTLGPDAAIAPNGRVGGCLDADATDADGLGAFRYKAEEALNPGDEDWTLECWLKAKPGIEADNRIWGLSGVNYIDYGRGEDAHGLNVANRFLPLDRVEAWNRPTGDLQADGQFHHVAIVYDSAAHELRHYFDGKLQFEAAGTWKDVPTGAPPYRDAIMPPHYPMLQIGMRDAHQQWGHREIHLHQRHMKKFQGYIDEMRFSDAALYTADFSPPHSLAEDGLYVWPQRLGLEVVEGGVARGETPVAMDVWWRGAGARPSVVAAPAWLTYNVEAVNGAAARVTVQPRIGPNGEPPAPGRHEGEISISVEPAGEVRVPVTLTVVEASGIHNVRDRKQLFIDRQFIESSDNLELHTNPAQKVGTDFEGCHYPRNIVYLDDKRVWRMYYSPWSRLEHAESADGVHWDKFGPGHIGYESEEEPGKLIPLDFGAMVMIDPHDTRERRFKAFQEVTSQILDGDGYEISPASSEKPKRELAGVYAFFSEDGLRFKKAGRILPVLPEFVSFAPQWDPNLGKYACWFRCQNTKLPGLTSIQGNQMFYQYGFTYEKPDGLVTVVAPDTMQRSGFENLRSVARIETDDLLKPWPIAPDAERNTMYATSTTTPITFSADEWDGFADFYVHATTIYPYAENVYLMFPTLFRHFHPSRQPYFHAFDDANGPLETTLAVSRDGIHWDRLDRKPYIPMGRNDEWDRARTMTGLGIARAGNDLYQFYWGSGDLHDSLPLRAEMKRDSKWHDGLGLVKQRLDGFVSAEVDYQGGSLTTPPITFSGKRLELNHSCGAQGTIFVELRDLNDAPLRGYELADCEEISCDDVAWEVRWRGSPDLSALVGRPIKIHFKMRSAKLFAFQFVNAKNASERTAMRH